MSELRISEYIVDHGSIMNRHDRRRFTALARKKRHEEKSAERMVGKRTKMKIVCSGSPMDMQSIRMRKKYGRKAGLPRRELAIP